MQLLCISDIHGHADALDRVLALGRARGCTQVLVAGDLCFPGAEPLVCWKLITAARAHCVQGLTDKAIATLDPSKLVPINEEERKRLDRMVEVRRELGELVLTRLARLPRSFRMATEDGQELLLVHGSPADPTVVMTHDMTDEELGELIGDETASVVICGGSHVPFDRRVGATRVLNVGSVGEAAGSVAHAMVVTTSPVGVEAALVMVPLMAGG